MKKGKVVMFVSIFMLCVSLFATLMIEDYLANKIFDIVTLITAILGAIALYIQFKRDKNINEASFLLEFWKTFSENPKLIAIQKKLDPSENLASTQLTEDDYETILTYAQWLEALCTIINRNIVSINFIDDMYNYMFFSFVNNKYIQERELLPNCKYYRGIFKSYALWSEYLKSRKKDILFEENSLLEAVKKYYQKP